jgi:hypothetical protein
MACNPAEHLTIRCTFVDLGRSSERSARERGTRLAFVKTTMAIYFMAMYICGASFGPLLTGKLSDLLAHRAAAAAGSSVVTEVFRAVGLQRACSLFPFCPWRWRSCFTWARARS